MYFRTIIGNIAIRVDRIFKNNFFSFKQSFNKVRILKLKHVNYPKYITIGKGTTIDEGARLDCYPIENEKTPNLRIGNNTMIGFNFTALCSSNLIIGNDVLIASNVFISTENHGFDSIELKYLRQKLVTKDVVIEDNVWIGENVSILSGVKIGKWSIVGANSVVTKDVPEYTIVCGNPAKIIKKYDFCLGKRTNIN